MRTVLVFGASGAVGRYLLPPLDAFAAWLADRPVLPRRVLALSSMSVESKRHSPDPTERELAARLLICEARILDAGKAAAFACTIFRPTLIYGAGIDRSLAPI